MALEKMTGVILSGGKNSRMGKNKAFLDINGVTLINRTVSLLRSIFAEIIIVTNSPLDYLEQNVTLVTDIFKEKGALGGLYSGLFFASYPRSFVCACDMPFLEASFIQYMVKLSGDFDIIVPHSGDGLQPMHAIYGKKCLPSIRNLFEQGNFKITDIYKGHKILTIKNDVIESFDGGRKMFLNVNTSADYAQIKALL